MAIDEFFIGDAKPSNVPAQELIKHNLYFGMYQLNVLGCQLLHKMERRGKPNKNQSNKSLGGLWRYLNNNLYHNGKIEVDTK